MSHRRRFKQSLSLGDRLAAFANAAREKADQLPPGSEQNDMLRKARQADAASRLEGWANSPGLQSPK